MVQGAYRSKNAVLKKGLEILLDALKDEVQNEDPSVRPATSEVLDEIEQFVKDFSNPYGTVCVEETILYDE